MTKENGFTVCGKVFQAQGRLAGKQQLFRATGGQGAGGR